MRPKATPEQRSASLEDGAFHRRWLYENSISEAPRPLGENPFNGLILSALLDPPAAPTVASALLGDAGLAGPIEEVFEAEWPTSGADIQARLGRGEKELLLFNETKRFRSPSHCPGYRRDPDAPWQTDQLYTAVVGTSPPALVASAHPDHEKVFVVLDAHGMSMEQMFPGGEHNDHWRVTGYAQFGAGLREAHQRGTSGLVPLLSALYSGADRSAHGLLM